jgi:hypothetical protein
MSEQKSHDDQRRDELLLRLLKTPPQSRAELAEAGAPEIEITSEMITEGTRVFLERRSLEFDTPGTAAFAIFSAMVSASLQLRTYCLVDLTKDSDF